MKEKLERGSEERAVVIVEAFSSPNNDIEFHRGNQPFGALVNDSYDEPTRLTSIKETTRSKVGR